jgi:uncharacterized protein YhfF
VEGHEELRIAEFGFPGDLRDRLVRAILDGGKTATASLVLEYELDPGERLPTVGERTAVVDSDDRRVAVIETTEVRILPFGQVDAEFARDEGEGFESVDDWRAAHVRFWESEPMKSVLGRPDFRVDEETMVVAERFRLIERLDAPR